MAKVTDLLSAFQYDPETFKADEFKAALAAAYQEDEGVWTAQVTEKDTQNTALSTELHKAKVANWDLLMGKGVTPAPGDAIGTMAQGKSDDSTEDPQITTDSFFGPKKEE